MVLPGKAAFQSACLHYVLIPGIIPPQMQDFSLPLVQLHESLLFPVLQPIDVLKGRTTMLSISYSSQLCIICKFAESAFCPIVQAMTVDVKTTLAPISISGVHH